MEETMLNHGCINGSLDGVNYSSPVPVIGLYVAGASAACMLLMLWDIGAAVFAKTRWLPCKVFKLDSVTLTLLGVAAKLPVDLTTPMPSPQDQLSKLTGTVIICISMGFLMPSLGVSNESDCFTNMVALSILVITVSVNICIQLHTGVIVLFFIEHIIILCLMFLLLLLLWHIQVTVKYYKRMTANRYEDLLTKGKPSMMGRVKECYLYSYSSDPQFAICKYPMHASIGILCVLCSITLIQAAIRSLILKQLEFCSGDSDYRWSVTFIIVTQTLCVIVGTMAVAYRGLAMFRFINFQTLLVGLFYANGLIQSYRTLGKWFDWYILRSFLRSLYMISMSAAQLLIVTPSWLLCHAFGLYRPDIFTDVYDYRLDGVSNYLTERSTREIINLRHLSTKELPKNVLRILAENRRGNNYPEYLRRNEMEVSSIPLTIIVKLYEVVMPKYQLGYISSAFKEASEIIHFIETTLQVFTSSEENDTWLFVQAFLKDGDFSHLLPRNILGMEWGLDRAVAIIHELRHELYSENLWSHLRVMVDFINLNSYSSMEELAFSMEQMFSDMLRAILSPLPLAIYRSLSKSQAEEFKERVQYAMNILFKIQHDDSTQWSLPAAPNLFSFISDEEDTAPQQSDLLEEMI